MTEDAELLRNYFRTGEESFLRTLMDRHLPLVYSVALRISESPELAAEAAQDVFLKLIRSPEVLMKRGVPFMAWLHRSARHRAIDLLRSERARKHRERSAAEVAVHSGDTLSAEALALLDEVIDGLPAKDRELVLERFFAERSLGAIGSSAGLSEDAVRMRLSRSLEKMRSLFSARGISTTAAMLATTLPLQALVRPPSQLSAGVTLKVLAASAGAGPAAATGGALSFLGLMNSAQKTALAAAVIAVAAITSGIYLISAPGTTAVASPVEDAAAGGRAAPHATAGIRPVSLREERDRIELVKKWLMDTSPEERDSYLRLQQTIGQLSVEGVRELLAERTLLDDVQRPERGDDDFPDPIYPRRSDVNHLLWKQLGKLTPAEALEYLVELDRSGAGTLERLRSVLPGVAKCDPALALRFLKDPPVSLENSHIGQCFEEVVPLLVKYSREEAFDAIWHVPPLDRKEYYLGYVSGLPAESDWPAEVERLERELLEYAELGFRAEGVAGFLAGAWACSDPDAAFAWIATDEANPVHGYCDAIRVMFHKEPREAFRWLTTWNPEGVDRDAIFSYVLVSGGAEQIRWVDGLLELISDPAQRTVAVKRTMKNLGSSMPMDSLVHLKSSPLLDDEARQAVEEMIGKRPVTDH